MTQILATVQAKGTVAELTFLTGDGMQSLINVFQLVTQFHVPGDLKIFPNQRGDFCQLNALLDDAELTDGLKDALYELSDRLEDVRTRLIAREWKASFPDRCLPHFPLQEVCGKLDRCLEAVYMDTTKHANPAVRKSVTYIHRWIEGARERAALFPYFEEHKAVIVCAIVLSNERLDLLIQLDDLQEGDIRAILQGRGTIQQLSAECEQLEATAQELVSRNQTLEMENRTLTDQNRELDTQNHTLTDRNRWLERENRTLTDKHQQLLAEIEELERRKALLTGSYRPAPEPAMPVAPRRVYHESWYDFSGYIPRAAPPSRDSGTREDIGFLGEAAVYRVLRDSGRFAQISWLQQCPTGQGCQIHSGGEVFFVRASDEAYDILIATHNATQLFVEVKSTSASKGDRIAAYHFSEAELNVFASATTRRESVLALVFEVRERPQIEFYSIGPCTLLAGLGQ
jgi:regulator of replication initiation timing